MIFFKYQDKSSDLNLFRDSQPPIQIREVTRDRRMVWDRNSLFLYADISLYATLQVHDGVACFSWVNLENLHSKYPCRKKI